MKLSYLQSENIARSKCDHDRAALEQFGFAGSHQLLRSWDVRTIM